MRRFLLSLFASCAISFTAGSASAQIWPYGDGYYSYYVPGVAYYAPPLVHFPYAPRPLYSTTFVSPGAHHHVHYGHPYYAGYPRAYVRPYYANPPYYSVYGFYYNYPSPYPVYFSARRRALAPVHYHYYRGY